MNKDNRIGIILAGGAGTRLSPLTKVISKQILPIYDKPTIYYSLSTLMKAGIKDIFLISSPDSIEAYKSLLGGGKIFGICIQYITQQKPEGIAQCFHLLQKEIKDRKVCLILGDNLFFGANFNHQITNLESKDATIFLKNVENAQSYGVAVLDQVGKISSIVEKPIEPISNLAITGLYFYDESVGERAKDLKKSKRGEFEITDLNLMYLEDESLTYKLLKNEDLWFDTGTFSDLLEASNFVKQYQQDNNILIGSPELHGLSNGWTNTKTILEQKYFHKQSDYYSMLLTKLNHEDY